MAKHRFTDFIVELYSNKTDEDRDRCRARLQEQYDACDSRMADLVKENRGNLSGTVELCGKVISSVNDSKNRCRELKDRIIKCQSMLQWNRDNIRKMWLESLEHKYAHRMLSEIQELRKIPREVKESLIHKKLEHTTDVIVSSVKLLDGSMCCNADALKDLKLELYDLQEKLYLMLLEDLRKDLNLTAFISGNFGQNLKDVTYDDVFSNTIPLSDFSFKELLNKVSFDRDYVAVLLNCINTMKRLPEAMDVLKQNCQSELIIVSQEVSKLMYDVIQNTVDASPRDLPLQKQHIFLVDLVEHMLAVFRKILDNYNSFFQILKNIVELNGITDVPFQAEDVYSILQTCVEKFVGPYLDMQLPFSYASKETFHLANSQNVGDIGSFFSPQHAPEGRDVVLFNFSNSSHGMSRKKYAHTSETETDAPTGEEAAPSTAVIVCRQDPRNVTLIFNHLKDFVADVEQCLGLPDCPLHAFLNDSARLFLDHVNSDVNRMLKSASVHLDSWNTCPAGRGSEKEVLSCTSILEGILRELQDLMDRLPDYSDHFLQLVYHVVLDYKDVYQRAFRQMFEEDEGNILSVSWARDRDIRRLMKSFLNWRHLEEEDKNGQGGGVTVESPEEVRLRNREESQLLLRNVRCEEAWEEIADPKKLANLARLQENLLWFSVRLLRFTRDFCCSHPGSDVSLLRKAIKEYEDSADTCLLALHLEARARCFRRLLGLLRVEPSTLFVREMDASVRALTEDLLQMEDVLVPALTPKEFKYVFEGLGELVSSLVVLVASSLPRADESSVRCLDRNLSTLQCCLAGVTESSLDRARHFAALLRSTPDDILDRVLDEGPRLSEDEYTAVFRLVASQDETGEHLGYYLEKLGMIFKRSAPAP